MQNNIKIVYNNMKNKYQNNIIMIFIYKNNQIQIINIIYINHIMMLIINRIILNQSSMN